MTFNVDEIVEKSKSRRKEIGKNINDAFENSYAPLKPKSVNPNLVSHDYVQIPQLGKVISAYELRDYSYSDWEDQHFMFDRYNKGLCMPTIPVFMQHWNNVRNVYNDLVKNGSKRKQQLFDARGNQFNDKEVKDIALHLMKDHRVVYGNSKGAWSYLDAKFEKREDGMYVLSEHKVLKDPYGNRILKPNKEEKLELCLIEGSYCNPNSLNGQGMPTEKSNSQRYVLGENLYFRAPRNKSVAGFGASSDRAGLNCIWIPSNKYSDLGVFGVADICEQGGKK